MARQLLPLVLPGIGIGILSAVALIALSEIANRFEDALWDGIPGAIGIDPASTAWIVLILTLTGVSVGLVVTFAPGRAGPDPATSGLAEPPMPLAVLPGVAIALVLGLAGGVSLGPENPILLLNISLAVAIGLRVRAAGVPPPAWASLAFAGTIGAMFGTPLGAALLISESGDTSGRPLFDRLFGPLVAASAGTATMLALGGESFALTVAPHGAYELVDLLTGSLIAAAVAALGLIAILAFPLIYAAFRRLGPPLLTLAVGGFLLGVLGAIGGPITLFKGLDEMKELTATAGSYSAAGLGAIAVIKLVAVLVAGTSGFRGGRIFPSVFVGVAIGLFVSALFPGIPEIVALSASLVGILVAVTRSGWLAIFMGALMVGDPTIVPLLCVVVLPAWLVVTGRPEMIAKPATPQPEAARPATA